MFFGGLILLVFSTNYIVDTNANFKIKKNVAHIFLGNSQPECAYNDSLIINFKNMANGGETYFYSYQKLKKIVTQNPQIESVYIEFNATNILHREDQKIWSDRYINHFFPTYNPFLEFEDHTLLVQKNSGGYQHALLKGLSYNIKRIVQNQYHFLGDIGGYKYLKRSKTQKILDSISMPNNKPQTKEKTILSNYDIHYLNKIIKLCRQNKITPFLVRSPTHERFQGNYYESLFQKVRQEQFSEVNFLDFKDFPLQNSEFGDLQHLNFKGARKFSIWFNQHILDSINKIPREYIYRKEGA